MREPHMEGPSELTPRRRRVSMSTTPTPPVSRFNSQTLLLLAPALLLTAGAWWFVTRTPSPVRGLEAIAAADDEKLEKLEGDPAPELEGGAGWLNTAAPIRLKDLRGKFVVLDFWTYCCI